MNIRWRAWLGVLLPVALGVAGVQCSGADAVTFPTDDSGVDATIDAANPDGLADTTNDVPFDSRDSSPDADASATDGDAVAPDADGGCTQATDCPRGQACDPTTGQCSTSCAGALSCNGGCCDGTACVGGDRQDRCGNNGAACTVCGGLTPTCAMGTCTSACGTGDGGVACGAGYCCNSGHCSTSSNTTCGSGGSCVDCSQSSDGPVCLSTFVCGCMQSSDCPLNQACKTATCGTACDPVSLCNGGCCAKGTCQPGTANNACGNVPQCLDCTTSCNPGPACLGGTRCGCASSAECSGDVVCGRLLCDLDAGACIP
jgi:hypothetical protein